MVVRPVEERPSCRSFVDTALHWVLSSFCFWLCLRPGSAIPATAERCPSAKGRDVAVAIPTTAKPKLRKTVARRLCAQSAGCAGWKKVVVCWTRHIVEVSLPAQNWDCARPMLGQADRCAWLRPTPTVRAAKRAEKMGSVVQPMDAVWSAQKGVKSPNAVVSLGIAVPARCSVRPARAPIASHRRCAGRWPSAPCGMPPAFEVPTIVVNPSNAKKAESALWTACAAWPSATKTVESRVSARAGDGVSCARTSALRGALRTVRPQNFVHRRDAVISSMCTVRQPKTNTVSSLLLARDKVAVVWSIGAVYPKRMRIALVRHCAPKRVAARDSVANVPQ